MRADDPNEALITLINAERSKHGLSPLKLHPALIKAAQLHSEDQASHDELSHYGLTDGSTWADRMKAAGYPGASLENAGENVGGGQTSPEQITSDWMSSSGHRACILRRDSVHCGFGKAQATRGQRWIYWTMDTCSCAPDPAPEPAPTPHTDVSFSDAFVV